MQSTTLVYSSHSRCNDIHNDWIVQRALRGTKRILFLPMSNGTGLNHDYNRQEYSWSRFSWFFDYYREYGLDAHPIYWSPDFSKDDADRMIECLKHDDVVIFGGGNPWTGQKRYNAIGSRFYDDPDMIRKLIHERQTRGLLTVGFSAGVDQLCEWYSSSVEFRSRPTRGFGLAGNIIALSHFENSRKDTLLKNTRRYPDCFVFGLPNDSGVAVSYGQTQKGNRYQIIQFIVDKTWNLPADQWHIKTRFGMNIQHYYSDGRHWGFNDGDQLVRIMNASGTPEHTCIVFSNDSIIDYATQQTLRFRGISEILSQY